MWRKNLGNQIAIHNYGREALRRSWKSPSPLKSFTVLIFAQTGSEVISKLEAEVPCLQVPAPIGRRPQRDEDQDVSVVTKCANEVTLLSSVRR